MPTSGFQQQDRSGSTFLPTLGQCTPQQHGSKGTSPAQKEEQPDEKPDKD
jgi:hypothetical protein